MYATDFEYDGKTLSSFGFIACVFDADKGVQTSDYGIEITFNTTETKHGEHYLLTSTQYDDCVSATFDICKDSDKYDDLEITNDEFRKISRWLSRKEYLPFRVIDSEHETDACYFDASFNINKIYIAEKLYGIELSMVTNRPYGYGQKQIVKLDISDTSKQYTFTDKSDEVGYIYPDVEITCNASGNLKLKNENAGNTTVINNVINGEIINIDGTTMQISTSKDSHTKLYDDFNYSFPMIVNEYDNIVNTFTSSIPCTVTFSYNPIIKNFI